MNYIGYIGIVFLVIGYVLLDSKRSDLFAPVNCLATILLMVHALVLRDMVFIFVNGFVAVMLAVKIYEQYFRKTKKKK
jgi:hypothetical protein